MNCERFTRVESDGRYLFSKSPRVSEKKLTAKRDYRRSLSVTRANRLATLYKI